MLNSLLNRRQFNQRLFAGSLLASTPLVCVANATATTRLASAGTDDQGQHWLHVFSLENELHHSVQLPARAHDVVFHPHKPWAVVTARRPGYYMWIVDYQSGEIRYQIEPEEGFHFYGHAVFSADGQQLFTTENEIRSSKGKVVVRDLTEQGRVITRFDSFGIGPHQLKLMPDQRTLVIANGGILTNPYRKREKLNLDTMDPSLVYIDSISGALQEQVKPPQQYHQLSIRHLDTNSDGKVIIGLQYQGDLMDDMPLVASHQLGKPLQLLRAPQAANHAMKQYVGSVCFDKSGRYAMTSCPKGNLVTLWDMEKQQFIDQLSCRDGCGLASAESGRFLISNGQGNMYRYDMLTENREKLPLHLPDAIAWDNHMTAVTL